MSGLIEWIVFLGLSVTAVTMAAGMLTTMSMYRAGLALMSSLVALAGLFILLDADLLAAIQVMMNVGGMLVMVLFMVMIMMDPGGEMMWDMKRKMNLPGFAALSMAMPRESTPEQAEPRPTAAPTYTCPMHPEIRQDEPGICPKCGMDLVPTEVQAESSPAVAPTYTCPMHPEIRQDEPGVCPKCGMNLVPTEVQAEAQLSGMPSTNEHAAMEHGPSAPPSTNEHAAMGHGSAQQMVRMSPLQHYQMMVDMAMSTAQLPWALAIGAATAAMLIALAIRTSWPLSGVAPTQDATAMVGELLLSRYMIGFEGAAFLILAGIVGAVVFGRRERALVRKAPTQGAPSAATTYTCPMHPEVRQDYPGQCPKCGMDLVSADAQLALHEQKNPIDGVGDGGALYTCPMHPQIRQSAPGACPICGMDLIPAETVPAVTDRHNHGGHA